MIRGGLAVLAVLALPPGTSTHAAEPHEFTCDAGPLGKMATQMSLARAFGAANVRRATDLDEEGYRYSLTKVFAGNKIQILAVNWLDNKDRNGPHTIEAIDKDYWRGPRGVRIGMSLADLEAANGRSFEFFNFNMDLGAGEVKDWKDGALHRVMRGCALSVTVGVRDPDAFVQKAPDVVLTSDNPAARAAGMTVVRMKLVFEPKP